MWNQVFCNKPTPDTDFPVAPKSIYNGIYKPLHQHHSCKGTATSVKVADLQALLCSPQHNSRFTNIDFIGWMLFCMSVACILTLIVTECRNRSSSVSKHQRREQPVTLLQHNTHRCFTTSPLHLTQTHKVTLWQHLKPFLVHNRPFGICGWWAKGGKKGYFTQVWPQKQGRWV